MAGVASDRFASLNCEDFDKILTEKDSKNTKRATEMAVKIFRTYLREKELPENFEEASASSLDDQLTRFYGEARQVNGQKYKTTTLIAIRHGINRHLQLKTAGMDIINSGDFKKSKQMFIAVTKDLKREGKGGITHYPPIETQDLQKMYDYFDLENNIRLQQKVFVDIMMYFGRRGRENLHLLKISDFAATTDSTGHLFIFMPNDELTKNHQDNPNTAEGRMYSRKGEFLHNNGSRCEKTCLCEFANNKGTDLSVHSLILTSAFVIGLLEIIISRLLREKSHFYC